jgi:hypothetical protein
LSEYYTATGAPATSSSLSSSSMRSEFALLEAGTDKLPTLSGNGDEIAVINSAGTAITSLAEAAFKTQYSLTIGTDLQAYDAELAAIAGLTSAADKGVYFTGSETAATFDLTSAGRALLDDASTSAQRTTLGLGSIATQASSAVSITGGTIAGITQLDVDNLRLNSNTVSSTDTNGNVNLVPDGTGRVVIQHTSNTIFQSDTGGIDIFSDGSAGSNVTLQMVDGDSQSVLLRKRGDTGTLELRNQEHGGTVALEAENAAGSAQTLVDGDPDGATTMYFAGTQALASTIFGVTVYDTAGNNPFVSLANDAGTDYAYFRHDAGTGTRVRSIEHGASVFLEGEDTGGTLRSVVAGSPDGTATLYYAGSSKVATTTGGADVTGTLNATTALQVGGTDISSVYAALGANSDITSLSGLSTPLSASQGGTGAATLTDNGVLLGSGTGAITATAALSDGEMIVGTGVGDPALESGQTLRQSIGVDIDSDVQSVNISAFKTSSTSRSSTTTLANDPDIAGISLESSTNYMVQGLLYITSSSSTPNFKFAFAVSSGSLSTSPYSYVVSEFDSSPAESNALSSLTTQKTIDITAGSGKMVRILVGLRTGTAPTIDLQWAQDVSDATSVDLEPGSFLVFTKLN